MTRIRLELDELKIDRPKKRWNVYFVVATDHPEDESKYVVTVTPDPVIPVRRPANNEIDFHPSGTGTDGLEILERPMPQDRSIEARVWVRHSRRDIRRAGDIINGLAGALRSSLAPIEDGVLGSNPYWGLAKTGLNGLGALGRALQKVRDRDLGFVSLDEVFGSEFEEQTELDRDNSLSTGFGKLGWNWSVVA